MKLSEMTPEEKRVAIAVGSKKFRDGWSQEGLLVGHRMWDGLIANIPDYLNDLNVMHEAVETLRGMIGPQWWDFQKHLGDCCGSVMNSIQATASQRADAFLLTLNLAQQ